MSLLEKYVAWRRNRWIRTATPTLRAIRDVPEGFCFSVERLWLTGGSRRGFVACVKLGWARYIGTLGRGNRERMGELTADGRLMVALELAIDQGKIAQTELDAAMERKRARLMELFGIKPVLRLASPSPSATDAMRAAVIEECAKVASDTSSDNLTSGMGDLWNIGVNDAAIAIADRIRALSPHTEARKPIKLSFTNEWLREKIMGDPDEASYEAGVSHPEAPQLRFFIDHGVIHDRVTGKHVRSTDIMHPHEDGIQACCDLLNSLTSPHTESRTSERECELGVDDAEFGMLEHCKPTPQPAGDAKEIPDDDDPQNWKELALAAISDLRRYANDESSERRIVSAVGYEERAVLLSSVSPPDAIRRALEEARVELWNREGWRSSSDFAALPVIKLIDAALGK